MTRTALILAGGFGNRLRSVVSDVPKPMASVAGRPFLSHILDLLCRQCFTHVVISVGYKSQVIVSHFGSSYRTLQLSYCAEESPLGTGGALRLALPLCQSDPVFVLNGDTFVDLECDALAALWLRFKQPVLVGRCVEDVSRYGAISTRDNMVIGFKEKTESGPGLINVGCYVLPRNFFDGHVLPSVFSFENDYLCHSLPNRPFHLYTLEGRFIDIGIPADYLRAQQLLASPYDRCIF